MLGSVRARSCPVRAWRAGSPDLITAGLICQREARYFYRPRDTTAAAGRPVCAGACRPRPPATQHAEAPRRRERGRGSSAAAASESSSPARGESRRSAGLRRRRPDWQTGRVTTSTMHPPSVKMEWTPWLLALSVVCCCLVSSSRAFQAPGRPRPTRATRQLTRGTCTSTTQQPRPLGDECHLSHRRRRRTRLRSTTEDRESTGAASGKQKAKWGQRTDADVSRYLADFIGPDGDLVDPYKLLGVRRTASPSDIKASYRRLSRKLHPDAVARSEILPGRW